MTALCYASLRQDRQKSQRDLSEHLECLNAFMKEWRARQELLLESIGIDSLDALSATPKAHFESENEAAGADPGEVKLVFPEIENESGSRGEESRCSLSPENDPDRPFPARISNGVVHFKHASTDEKRRSLYATCASEAAMLRSVSTEFAMEWHSKPLRAAFDATKTFLPMFTQVVLVADAAVISMQTDFAVQHPGHEGRSTLDWFGMAFTIYYSLEVILKLCVGGRQFLCGPEWRWNAFDVFLTLQAIYDHSQLAVLSSNSQVSWQFLRMLRLLKVLKLLRIIRLMRSFRELRLIVSAAVGSLRVMFWAVSVVLSLTFFFGVCIVQIRLLDLESNIHAVDIDKYWGSVGTSMLSLLMATTGGQEWDILREPLLSVGPLAQVAFIGYIFLYAYGIQNIINAIFIDNMTDCSDKDHRIVMQKELEKKQDYIGKLQVLFDVIDDGSGVVGLKEFERLATSEKLEAFFESLEIDASDATELFKALSGNGSFKIDLDHFVTGCLKLKGFAKSLDLIALVCELQNTLQNVEQEQNRRFEETKNLLGRMAKQGKTPFSQESAQEQIPNENEDVSASRELGSQLNSLLSL